MKAFSCRNILVLQIILYARPLVPCFIDRLNPCLDRFLMEIGALLLFDEKGAGLSLQSVYEKLEEEKNGCCWELYELYKRLKSLGYIVVRHGVPWTLKCVKSDDVAAEDKFIADKLEKLDLNELRPAFDVYLPNSKFRKSSPGDPSYVLCFTGYRLFMFLFWIYFNCSTSNSTIRHMIVQQILKLPAF